MFQIKMDIEGFTAMLSRIRQDAISAASQLSMQGASEYRDALHKAITGQSFPSSYPPLADWYSDWKLKTVHHADFWKLYGDLLSSIGIRKAPDNDSAWLGGVADTATNREGKGIAWYAEITEKKRPLFAPVARQISEDQWQKLCSVILDTVMLEWR